jgi:hypothetical protein
MLNSHFALAYCLRMIFSDLPSPAEARHWDKTRRHGFAQAGNRHPPSDQSPRASFFGIML